MRRASGDLWRKMIYGQNEIRIPDDSSQPVELPAKNTLHAKHFPSLCSVLNSSMSSARWKCSSWDESSVAQTSRSLERVAILRKLLLLGSLSQWRDLWALMKKHFALTTPLSRSKFPHSLVIIYCSRNVKLYDCESCYLKLLRPSIFFSTRGFRWKSHWPFPSIQHSCFRSFYPRNNVEANAFWQNFSEPLSSSRHHQQQHKSKSIVVLLMNLCAALTPTNGWS